MSDGSASGTESIGDGRPYYNVKCQECSRFRLSASTRPAAQSVSREHEDRTGHVVAIRRVEDV